MSSLIIGVDVGGTFTDLVAIDAAGHTTFAKSPSTPQDQSIGEWHSVGGLKFGSIEVAEARFPLHFRHHEFLPDSAGDGQFRGGLGVALELVFETAKTARGNTAGEGTRHGSAGMLGGADSPPHRYQLVSEGKPPRELRTKETGIEILPGDCLEVRSAGGGGYGPPEKRTQAARERDRLQGLVTDDAVKGISR